MTSTPINILSGTATSFIWPRESKAPALEAKHCWLKFGQEALKSHQHWIEIGRWRNYRLRTTSPKVDKGWSDSDEIWRKIPFQYFNRSGTLFLGQQKSWRNFKCFRVRLQPQIPGPTGKDQTAEDRKLFGGDHLGLLDDLGVNLDHHLSWSPTSCPCSCPGGDVEEGEDQMPPEQGYNKKKFASLCFMRKCALCYSIKWWSPTMTKV